MKVSTLYLSEETKNLLKEARQVTQQPNDRIIRDSLKLYLQKVKKQ